MNSKFSQTERASFGFSSGADGVRSSRSPGPAVHRRPWLICPLRQDADQFPVGQLGSINSEPCVCGLGGGRSVDKRGDHTDLASCPVVESQSGCPSSARTSIQWLSHFEPRRGAKRNFKSVMKLVNRQVGSPFHEPTQLRRRVLFIGPARFLISMVLCRPTRNRAPSGRLTTSIFRCMCGARAMQEDRDVEACHRQIRSES
jgi:hypothetical protein